MPSRNVFQHPIRLVFLLAIIMAVVLTSGCSTGGGHSRGSVSNATDRAAQEENAGRDTGRTRSKTDHENSAKDEQWVDDYYADQEEDEGSFLGNLLLSLFAGGGDDGADHHEHDTGSSGYTAPTEPPRDYEFSFSDADSDEPEHSADDGDSATNRHNVIAWYSKANLAGDTIEDVSTVSILYSSYLGKRFRGHLGIYYGEGQKGSQERVQTGIRNLSEFGVDLGGRDYLTPHHTLMGFYLLYGARAGFLRWSYTTGIEAPSDDGSEIINSDAGFLLTPYIGVGTSIVQLNPFHLGASVSWGPRFTLFKTIESFDNDLFRDVGELRVNFEMSVFF